MFSECRLMRCRFWKVQNSALPAGHILPCNPSLCWQRQKRGFRQEASQLCANSSSSSLKSLREQIGSCCSDEIRGVCCKLRHWRALSSREALAACTVLPGPGNYWKLFPRHIIPTEQGPAAAGGRAAIM